MTGQQERGQYTREFKVEAVRQVRAGQAIAVVAIRVGRQARDVRCRPWVSSRPLKTQQDGNNHR